MTSHQGAAGRWNCFGISLVDIGRHRGTITMSTTPTVWTHQQNRLLDRAAFFFCLGMECMQSGSRSQPCLGRNGGYPSCQRQEILLPFQDRTPRFGTHKKPLENIGPVAPWARAKAREGEPQPPPRAENNPNLTPTTPTDSFRRSVPLPARQNHLPGPRAATDPSSP